MIAMNTRRHRRLAQPTAHKLQQGHLRTRILHGHTIGLQLHIGLAADVPPAICVAQQRFLGVVKVRVENFFREGQGPGGAEHTADFCEAREEERVGWGARGELGAAGRGQVVRGCEASSRRKAGAAEGGESVRLCGLAVNARPM